MRPLVDTQAAVLCVLLEDLTIVPGGYSSQQPSAVGTAVSDCSLISGTTFMYHDCRV